MTLYGKVLSVTTKNLGEPVTAAAIVGATTLNVADAATFDELGGVVSVAGEQLIYTAIDADLDTITLAAALTTAVADDAFIEVYPPSPVKVAQVNMLDGSDLLPVIVPHTLKDKLVDGLRTDATAETVAIEQRGMYEYLVADVSAEDLVQTSLDYTEGEQGIGLSETVAQFQDVQVVGQVGGTAASFDTINLAGVPLSEVLGDASIGKLLSARLPAQAANIAITTTNTKIFELNCGTVQAGRTYRVATSMLLVGTAPLALTDRIAITYTYTTDGTAPTTASATMDGGFNDLSYQSGSFTFAKPEAELDIATEAPLRIALCVRVLAGSGAYSIYALAASPRSRPVMSFYDDGPSGARNDAALSLTGGGVARFVKTYNATWAFGANTSYGNPLYDSYLYIGGEADQCGFVGFDSASMVAQLAGATTPVSCVLRWRARSRRTSTGLDVKLATHNFASSTTAAAPSGGLPYFAYSNLATYGLTLLSNVRSNAAPGSTYDESLGTTVFNQFKAGSRKGVAFLGTPEASTAGGEGSVYGDGAYQCQLIFTYDGTS